jgi:protoporphyrinogen/coproporphyrinogen III oxidase
VVEIAVVGGGIAGLAAALRLRDRLGPDAGITIVEQSARLGGKLRTVPLAGGPVEAGAETFLMRDPDGSPSAAVLLAERVGLAGAVRHPTGARAALAIGGSLRPMPAGTLMGVPADPSIVDGLATVAAGRDRDAGRPLLAPGQDVAVGALVRDRFGDEVTDRLVDPLLGGVYAGRADDLSLAVTVPALARAAREQPTLAAAVRAALPPRPAESAGARPAAPGSAGPVFGTIEGGMGRLVSAVEEASAARLVLGSPVRELVAEPAGWRLVLGPVPDPTVLRADAVVLAVPARPAARLLAGVAPEASRLVGELDYASVALVRLAVPGAELPELSGFLVPAVEGYAVKALTIFSTKWEHLRRPDGTVLLRASLGRYGDTAVLQRSDAELVDLARRELAELLGARLPAPVAADVVRWGGGLPQYRPGHLDRVAAARAALADRPTLALAGAACDGVGIPACVRSGEAAADSLLDLWA